MFYRMTLFVMVLVFGPLAIADQKDPPVPQPGPPSIIDEKGPGPILPDGPQEDIVPKPSPATSAIGLRGDRMYVTRWSVPFDIECFPNDALINISSIILDDKAGEKMSRIFGRYVDGPQGLEWRKYPQKYQSIITAKENAVGSVDCLFVVEGQKTPRKRVTLSVNGGSPTPVPPAPIPNPPGPTPPVPPKPEPSPDVKASKLRIVVVREQSDATPSQAAIYQNTALNARIKEKGHTWRIVDKDVKDKDGNQPKDLVQILKLASGKGLPQLFLVDEEGDLRFQGDLPKTAAEVLALVTKWGG